MSRRQAYLGIDPALQSALRKASWRFIPLLVAAYVLNYLDRTCIGFAGLAMNQDIGLTSSQFGVGAGIFFLGYCLSEVPSNAILYRVGASRWLARIMISWGLASAGAAFVVGPQSFYAVRLLLGIAEAGYFPGAIYFIGCWFPPQQRVRYVGMMLLGIPASSIIGGPLCGALLKMNGLLGIAGWKWLFLMLSLPCVLLGVLALRLLIDSPQQASWLNQSEREALQTTLGSEVREQERSDFWGAMADPRVLLLAGVQFGFTVGSYAINIWLPLILKEFALSNSAIGLLSSLPYIIASIVMLIWAWQVDKRGHKILNVVAGCVLAALGLGWAVAASHSMTLSLLGITVALIGVNAARTIFWTLPGRFLVGAGAAGGLAFINSIGTVGGFTGPALMGWLKDATGSFQVGIGALAGVMLASGVLTLGLRRFIHQD
jgi:ACS family tartrate transporter-like MFS transporter